MELIAQYGSSWCTLKDSHFVIFKIFCKIFRALNKMTGICIQRTDMLLAIESLLWTCDTSLLFPHNTSEIPNKTKRTNDFGSITQKLSYE